jgi:hypothetical protein
MTRKEEITTTRRRRNTDAMGGRRGRLSVATELDTDNYVYRWANDEGTRIHELTVGDDYDVVTDRAGVVKPDGISTGSEVAVSAGAGEHGRPVRAVLLRKPKHLHMEDKRLEQSAIDAKEASIRAGSPQGGGGDPGMSYVPKGTPIKIDHGAR